MIDSPLKCESNYTGIYEEIFKFQSCKSTYRGKFLIKDIPQGYTPLKIIQYDTGYSAASFVSANTKQVIICNAGINLSNIMMAGRRRLHHHIGYSIYCFFLVTMGSINRIA